MFLCPTRILLARTYGFPQAKQFKSLLGQLRSKYAVFTPILKVVQFAIKFLWRSSGDSSSKLGKAGRADTWIRVSSSTSQVLRILSYKLCRRTLISRLRSGETVLMWGHSLVRDSWGERNWRAS